MTTITPTKFGRVQTPEAPSALARIHLPHGTPRLTVVDHEPRVGVLDQEDLLEQGINIATFIPGAPTNVDALGSCTCNALMAHLSRLLPAVRFAEVVSHLGAQPAPAHPYQDVVAVERAAIGAYHDVTDQTGQPASEWPPTDCGSSGPYLYQWTLNRKLIATERIASGADAICSMLQADGVLIGLPFLNDWMTPDAYGFMDGDGTASTIERQIRNGIAGGHEMHISAIEKLHVHITGHVDPFKTVLRLRNSWSAGWGDNGSARLHLSTLVALGSQIDVRQFRPYPAQA